MFNRKYLKQLQDVQTRIKSCKKSLANLDPPQPDSLEISKSLHHWLSSLFYRNRPDASLLYDSKFIDFNGPVCDYLYQLGKYFLHTASYHEARMKYTEELDGLYKEERRLKEKLGID